MYTGKALELITRAEDIFNSDADWKFKYEVIFAAWNNSIAPELRLLGIRLDWHDPDATYREDVTAFMEALLNVKKNLLAIG